MKKEPSIPAAILELIAEKKFEALSVEEKMLVKQFITPAEYDELYEADESIKRYFSATHLPLPPEKIKQHLDQAFHQKHPKPVPILHRQIQIWKVAAGILVLLSGFYLYQKKNSAIIQPMVSIIHDTIYTIQQVESVIHDTTAVYIPSVKNKRNKILASVASTHKSIPDTNRHIPLPANIGIRTLQTGDINKEWSNTGSSMAEDELLYRFRFAKI